MHHRFTTELKDVIRLSRLEAIAFGYDYIGTEHLLLGILHDQTKDCSAVLALQSLSVQVAVLKQALIDVTYDENKKPAANVGSIPLTKQAETALKMTCLEADRLHSKEINSFHLLQSILRNKNTIASLILRQFNVNHKVLKQLTPTQQWYTPVYRSFYKMKRRLLGRSTPDTFAAARNKFNQLIKLNELIVSGSITQSEYDVQKEKLLV